MVLKKTNSVYGEKAITTGIYKMPIVEGNSFLLRHVIAFQYFVIYTFVYELTLSVLLL